MSQKIYERIYDNPINPNGNKKPNKCLGTFKILQTIREDTYSSLKIGIKEGKNPLIYMIEEVEVLFVNAGSKFKIIKLSSKLQKLWK